MDSLFWSIVESVEGWGASTIRLERGCWLRSQSTYQYGLYIDDGNIEVFHHQRDVVLVLELSDPEVLEKLRGWLEREGLLGEVDD